MGIMISIGKWGGVYVARGWALRICLGWLAITLFPVDGDYILAAASYWGRVVNAIGSNPGHAALVERDGTDYHIESVEVVDYLDDDDGDSDTEGGEI